MNMISNSQSTQEYDRIARLFKALSHPVRLAIVGELQNGEACVCHLEARLGVRQAYLSQQLAVLRDAGLVKDSRDGWNVYYSLSDPVYWELLIMASRLAGFELKTADLCVPHDCSCPRCKQGSS